MSNTTETEGNESQRKEPTLSSALGDMSSVIGVSFRFPAMNLNASNENGDEMYR